MLLSGFTFVRNGVLLDYTFLEAIRSLSAVCEEVVVAVGKGDDDTRERIVALADPKVRIIDTIWDDSMRVGGGILAVQTDLAKAEIKGRWGLYLQADEVLHESGYNAIRKAVQQYDADSRVEGLLLQYTHFYGSYDFVLPPFRMYRREVRIVRNDPTIKSWGDAQGFRKNGQKLLVKPVKADIFHYGHARNPEAQLTKLKLVSRFWKDDAWMEAHATHVKQFDYDLTQEVIPFRGEHPAVMAPKVAEAKDTWAYKPEPAKFKTSFSKKIRRAIARLTGWYPGEYQNYRIV